MTDQTIPADKLRKAREWVEHASETMGELPAHAFGAHAGFHAAVDVIMSLPEPALPTLADMTPEEREKCQWMQADWTSFDGRESERVIVVEGHGKVITRKAEVYVAALSSITPRPDLPKMEWPGSEPDDAPESPREVLVTVEDYAGAPVGTIVKKTDLPGSQAFQKWDDGDWLGTVHGDENPWSADDMAGTPRTVIWEPVS